MKKYLKVFLLLLKLNLASLIAYRANFINSFVINVGWGVVSILQIIILTNKTASVYGWSKYELYILAGIYGIVIGLFHMFFSSNFERFSRITLYGQMDGYLIKPIDPQFLLTCSIFRPLHIFRIILGIGFVAFVLQIIHVHVNFLDLIEFSLLVIGSVVIMYSFWLLVTTVTIWFSNLSNLADMLYNVSNIGRYPPQILLKTGNVLLFILVPLTLISSVPGRLLIHKITSLEIFSILFFAISLYFLSRKFFTHALKSYTSASS